ncbi:MAG: hypothetical protein ACI4KF_07710 [Huintestinicola sp.]
MEPHEMAEKLVEKCGISYEEAAEVLRETNFDLLEAMVILEKRGHLGSSKGKYSTGSMNIVSTPYTKTAADAESLGEFFRLLVRKICEIFRDILAYQIVASKNGSVRFTFPLIFAVIICCVTAGMAVILFIATLMSGYSYSVEKR